MISAEEIVSESAPERQRLLKTCRGHGAVALQLGGSQPEVLVEAVSILKSTKTSEWMEINLNCGCPSPRVAHQSDSCFGARLMHQPDRVRACVHALSKASGSTPVTVKCRLGTDEQNGYDRLANFVSVVRQGGVKHFAVHARECVLDGLNPAQNRSIPPLRPRWVHSLQRDFPDLSFAVNGGIKSLDMALRHLAPGHDGYGSYEGTGQGHEIDAWHDLPAVGEVMIGREAFSRPWMLRHADPLLHARHAPTAAASRDALIEAYLDEVERDDAGREYLAMQPLLTLFAGERGGKAWRRQLQEGWKAARGERDVRAIVEDAREAVPLEVREAA